MLTIAATIGPRLAARTRDNEYYFSVRPRKFNIGYFVAINPQAMVSMMLPSALVELLEELEFELPSSAIELSMNDEIID